MKNKNDLSAIVDILREENLSLKEFCTIGAELFDATITASVSVSPEAVPASEPITEIQQQETSVLTTEEPEPPANSKNHGTTRMSAEDKLVDMSVSINGDRYVSLIDLVAMVGCTRWTFIKMYPDLIKNAISATTEHYKKFVKLEEAKSLLFFDEFKDLCSAEECGKRLGLGVATIYKLAQKSKLKYWVRGKTRMYNIKKVVECRRRYEDWSLLHDGSAPNGNRVMARLTV